MTENKNITVLSDTNINITKIYHFADLHIKANISTDLYQHYINLFDQIEEEIKKQGSKTSLICICGDIMDTVYTTECIKIIKLLFNKLASLCPIIYIIGNHDTSNKRNIDFSDMITPIVHEYFNSKYEIHPLLKEGLYQYNNVIFGVTNMDSLNVFPCEIKNKNKIKISLYHGQVSHPTLDAIIKKQCNLDVKDFKKYYDYAFLGDCHGFGYLDDDKTVAYSGSMYEVNYREVGIKKGFIMWDIKNKKSKFIELDGQIKHKILKIKNNILEGYVKNEIPLKVKIKLVYDDDTKIEKLDEIEKKLKKECNVIEYIVEKDFSATNLNTNVTIGNKQKTINDIKSYDVVIKMISDHIKEKYKCNKSTMEKIGTYLKKIVKDINFNFFEKPSTFKLKRLEFDNINSYGENNVIDFNLFTGKICEVSGHNGMGKSSILTVLLLGLYNECDNGSKYDCLNIKNIDKPAKIIIDFEVNGSTYQIKKTIRVRSHVKRDCHEDLLFYKDGKEITGHDNNETQKKINELIGNYDNMIDTNVILQRNYKAFMDLNNNDKKKVISKISRLDVFDILAKHVRSELASLQKKVPMLVKQINELFGRDGNYDDIQNTISIDTDILKEELEKHNEEKKDLVTKQEGLNKTKIELEYQLKGFDNKKIKTIESLKELKQKIKLEENDMDELKDVLIDIKTKLSLKKFKDFDKKIEKFNCDKKNKILELKKQKDELLLNTTKIFFNEVNEAKKLASLKSKLKKMQNEIVEIDDDMIETKYEEYKNIKSKLDIIETQIKKINLNIKKYKDKQKHVNNLDHNPDCEHCVKLVGKITFEENIQVLNDELNDVTKEKKINTIKLKKYEGIEEKYYENVENIKNNKQIENDVKLLEKDILGAEKDINKNTEIEKNNKKINIQIKELNDEVIELEKSELKNIDQYEKYKKDILETENEIQNKNDTIKSLQNKIDNYENFNKVKQLSSIVEEYEKITKKIKTISSNIINKTKTFVENELKIKQAKKIREEIDCAKKEKQLVEYINKTLEKDGIQDTILINNIIPKLQQDVNALLHTLGNFSIEIKYLNKTLQVYKIINKKDRILKLSGYEHMILGLCFRLVFCGLSQQKCKFVCFDEIFTFADNDGIQKIGQLFEYIKSRFDFALVISHNDNIKKFCDMSLNIKKEMGFSKINI